MRRRGAVVARGAVNVAIPVRGGFPYRVCLEGPDAPAQGFCGETFVVAGESITLRCGSDAGTARLEGRVVDGAGRPLPGLTVAVGGDRMSVTTTTDLDGRFAAVVELTSAANLGHLVVEDPAGRLRVAARRNIALRAGGEVLLETVVMRTEHEVAAARGSGGVGVGLELDPIGARVVEVPLDAPGGLAGLEPGDAIVGLDGAPLGRLFPDDIRTMLGGEPGTSVELRVRTPAGELYDVTIDRAPCDAVASACVESGDRPPW